MIHGDKGRVKDSLKPEILVKRLCYRHHLIITLLCGSNNHLSTLTGRHKIRLMIRYTAHAIITIHRLSRNNCRACGIRSGAGTGQYRR